MATDQFPGTEDEGVAALLVAAAEALLGASKSGIPKEFVDGLFARAMPEDVVAYNAREVAARRAEIVQATAPTLADVRVCVHDWRPMMDRVQEAIVGLKTNPPPLPTKEIAEAIQFLDWLIANNFAFLGVRNYVFTADQA